MQTQEEEVSKNKNKNKWNILKFWIPYGTGTQNSFSFLPLTVYNNLTY